MMKFAITGVEIEKGVRNGCSSSIPELGTVSPDPQGPRSRELGTVSPDPGFVAVFERRKVSGTVVRPRSPNWGTVSPDPPSGERGQERLFVLDRRIGYSVPRSRIGYSVPRSPKWVQCPPIQLGTVSPDPLQCPPSPALSLPTSPALDGERGQKGAAREDLQDRASYWTGPRLAGPSADSLRPTGVGFDGFLVSFLQSLGSASTRGRPPGTRFSISSRPSESKLTAPVTVSRSSGNSQRRLIRK